MEASHFAHNKWQNKAIPFYTIIKLGKTQNVAILTYNDLNTNF